MARPKKDSGEAEDAGTGLINAMGLDIDTEVPAEVFVIPSLPAKLPIDHGREDLNNIAKTVNQLIDLYASLSGEKA